MQTGTCVAIYLIGLAVHMLYFSVVYFSVEAACKKQCALGAENVECRQEKIMVIHLNQ